MTGLKPLKARRQDLSFKFALNCTKKDETMSMFPLKPIVLNTRKGEKYRVTPARTSRLAKSAIPTMQRQLNNANL